MRCLAALGTLLACVTVAHAQDKYDNLRGSRLMATSVRLYSEDSLHHPTVPHLHGAFSTTGIFGNADGIRSYTFNNTFKASLATKAVTLNLNGSWIYGEAANILSNNDFTTTFDANWYEHPEHFYYWGLAAYTTSHSLAINRQEQAGAGVGYSIIDKKKVTLTVSDGLLYENGDLYDSLYGGPGGSIYQRDRYETVRNSLRLLGHWVLYGRLTLDATWYYQNALTNGEDYIMKFNGSISFKMKNWLNFTTNYVYNKFTRTRAENTLLTFGLTLTH